MQEIAIRVRLAARERLGLSDYERTVQAVATLAAVVRWLPTPEARLVLRGRGSDPVRVETVSTANGFEMVLVLDDRSSAVERAAVVVASAIATAAGERVDGAAGVVGELDRLDRSAPRGRSVAERALRRFLEDARTDVVAGRLTARVRAASALVRLAEDGAMVVVERVVDPAAPAVEGHVVDDVPEPGDAVVVAETPDEAALMADAPVVVGDRKSVV